MTATVTNVVRIVSLFVLLQTICVTYTVKYDEKIASEMKVVTNYFTFFFLFLVKSLAIYVFSELTASTLARLQLWRLRRYLFALHSAADFTAAVTS